MCKKALYLLIALIAFILMLMTAQAIIKPKRIGKVEVLQDGWYVRYNKTEYNNVKLSNLRRLIGNGTYRSDKIIMTKTGVDFTALSDPALMLETKFSAFIVSIDGMEIEHKFLTYFERDEYVGCERNFVNMPKMSGKHEITIELLVGEDGAYNYFDAPVFGEYTDLFMYGIYNNMYIFIISAFLVIFGFMFFIIALGFESNFPEIRMLMFSALLFIDLGVWFLTQFKLLSLFMETGRRQTEAEYISLYLIVPLMYLVMGSMRNYLKKKRFLAFSAIGTLLSFLPIFLHYTGQMHINKLLWLYQINALTLIVFMFFMLFGDEKNRRISPSQRIQLAGQAMLGVAFIVNVFFYYLEVAGVMEQIMLSKKIVPVGALCMVFSTLVNYNIYISASIARKKEYQSLTHYAYADGLTDIPNRARFEKYLNDISKKNADYCIVSIDLNGLKTINDVQGHLMGDKYIREFADILEECVAGRGFVARTGGDEFVAVLSGDNLEKVERVIDEVKAALAKLNQEDPELKRSAAFGYAYRHETDGDSWNDVFMLADERMYKNKAFIKGE
ncbi:GGDEF domain-containing protein [Butyrivibrio sp. XBB1001]|uniref:GGDEF domain-containing protein n=1 Tax=Butyrivibrio sp. XBB1001 TaxID=1280682 RepID=UPI0004284BE6|nr:GGDEF domain-containing protein [Butyrivibrio sp. XBB1001]